MMDIALTLFYWGLPSLSLVLSLSILVILILSKKDRTINAFMPLVIALGFWSFSSLMMKLSLAPGTLFWNQMMVAGVTLVPFCAYLFFNIYIDRKSWFSIVFWTVIFCALLLINFLGYTTLSAEMIPLSVGPYIELHYTLGWGAYLSYGVVFAQLLVSFWLARSHVKSSVLITQGLRSVVVALFVIFIGIGTNLLPVIGKYPLDFFAGSIASLLLMRAIYANRILELRIVITKALVFTALLVVITIGSTVLLNRVWEIFHALNTGIDDSIFIMGLTLVVILLFQPLFTLLYRLVNQFFYKEEKLREAEVHGFTEMVANNLNAKDISEELIKVSLKIVDHGRIYLFLKDEKEDRFNLYASTRKLERTRLSFASTHPFVQWFSAQNNPLTGKDLDHHPLFKSMWEEDVNALNELLFEVALPLKAHNDLIGMLLLCHNDVRSIQEFSHIESLELLCSTASMALTNALLYEKAKSEAITDGLTQTYNHRYFMEALQTNIKAKPDTLALVLFGIDSLTVYNDIYGHLLGDAVLLKIGDRIKRCVSEGVEVFRYGGDIFAILLQHKDTKQSYDIAERIRTQIEHLSVSTTETERFLTVSAGLCIYPSGASDADTLLKNANTALIHSKRSGRNRTTIFNAEVSNHPNQEFELDENQWATIYALTATIDAKDHITFGHSQRVAQYATAIAKEMLADEVEVEIIRQASLLHDIGKIGIPENVLTKTTRLTEEEYEIMKRHVDMSVTIIKYLPTFKRVIPCVIAHHERFDGQGYPRNLKGDNIPFGARCIAIADAFDAITSDRHYKPNHTIEFAMSEITRNAGTQFDPILASTFVRLINQGTILVEPTRSANMSMDAQA